MTLDRTLALFMCVTATILAVYVTKADSAVYDDHPLLDVNLIQSPQYNVVGQIKVIKNVAPGKVSEEVLGTGVIVSPCIVASVGHVILGNDLLPIPNKQYKGVF